MRVDSRELRAEGREDAAFRLPRFGKGRAIGALVAALAVWCLGASLAFGGTKVWIGQGETRLASDAGNWDGGVPVEGDKIIFDGRSGKTCIWDLDIDLALEQAFDYAAEHLPLDAMGLGFFDPEAGAIRTLAKVARNEGCYIWDASRDEIPLPPELLGGMNEDPEEHLRSIFTENYDEVVLLRDVPFYSICEHHLMPFIGSAHVAYLPTGSVLGVSKLARIVECFARRLHTQERLTYQIADFLMNRLKPRGVAVVLEALAVARCDWIVFVDIRQRCVQDLAAFGAVVWPLALCWSATVRTASSHNSGSLGV